MESMHKFDHNRCVIATVNSDVLLSRFDTELIVHTDIRREPAIDKKTIRFLSGSMAELLTDELFCTFGDVDIMRYETNSLGFFEDVNKTLIDKIDKYKYSFYPINTLFKFIPEPQYIGYVRVFSAFILNFERSRNCEHKISLKINVAPISTKNCRTPVIKPKRLYQTCEMRGPAEKTSNMFRSFQSGSKLEEYETDDVVSIICYSWPPEASEWINRPRKHGWPDDQTISLVLEGGCHIVPVAHDDCAEDEFQWRISFSRAEVVLMKAMTPSQHYIYHMMRYFVKKELIQKGLRNSDQAVTMYVVKTLMLWQCEKKSAKFWRMQNTIELCRRLLKTLLKWLTNGNCENYFMIKCNLFYHKIAHANKKIVMDKMLKYTDLNRLSEWFDRENESYHRRCSEIKGRATLSFQDCLVLTEEADRDKNFKQFMLYEFYMHRLHLGMRLAIDNSSFVGVCVNNMNAIDDFFVDFLKGYVTLQASAFSRNPETRDNMLAMLSSLYFKQTRCINNISPSVLRSSIFQLISCKYYYEVAKIVLSNQFTLFGSGYFVTINLVKK